MIDTVGIVVTYNRKDVLKQNIESLLMQNHKLDILVVDNNSNDGTKELIDSYGEKVMYINTGANVGGAGGFYTGLKSAYEMNKYDYFWLMDDDGKPYNNDTLFEIIKIIEKINSKDVIINSTVVHDDTLELSFGLPGCKNAYDVQKASKDDIFYDEINPFNGTFVTKEVVSKIGFPKKEFFISGDEFEYTLRAKANGCQVMTASKSLYLHPQGIYKFVQFMGKKFSFRDVQVWRVYCYARNYAYIADNYYSKKYKLKYIIEKLVTMFYYKDKKLKKMKITILGLYDGFKNKFNRELDLSE